MLKNYLLMALRNLRKQKGYALINVAGLAIGMACCILILSFILTELSYDRYHEKADRIYRLIANLTLGNTPNMIATTNPMSSISMREEFAEVKEVVRLFPYRRAPVKHGDIEFYEEGIFYADATIFDVFTYPMLKGDPKSALVTANSLVLTEEMAEKYFGDQDPIGKMLKLNNRHDCKVTGVIQNVPSNSHFTFDMLLSLETFIQENKQMFESWMGPFMFHAYLLLEENADDRALEQKFPALIEKHAGESLRQYGAALDLHLQPLTKTHLYSDYRHEIAGHSDIKYVYIFAFVAVFVLLIACFNFMNIGTARSLTRAKEVGMRKVLGADKGKLIRQFLGESLVYSFISLGLAVVLAQIALPAFRSLADRPLSIDYTLIPWLIPGLIGLAFLVGLFAGSYPAFFLASFQPVKVLKDILKSGLGNYRFRQVLVLTQFVISITLIICTLVVFKQLLFMKNKNLGFDKEHVVVVPIMENKIRQSIEAVKQELQKHPGILNVAAGSHEPGGRPSGGSYQPEGWADGKTVMMDGFSIDHDYIPTLDIDIVAGRNFSPEFPADGKKSILINEYAVKEIGWDDPIGKTIKQPGAPEGKTIVGVIKDWHFQAPHKHIRGHIVNYGQAGFFGYRFVFVKLAPGNIPETLAFLKNKWREFDPNRTLDYHFLDSSYDMQYRSQEKLSQIFTYFTALAIFIACLGLLGMSAFVAEQRTKEIGIRKVLGASVPNVVVLLSKELIIITVIANVIAWPLSYFMMNRWLQDFPFRTEIGILTFLLSAALIFLIGLVTTSFQSIKASLANPVEALRFE